MATSRSLLAINNLPSFTSYCEKRGWTQEGLKSPYEVLRMRNPASQQPLIVYKKLSAEVHLTTHGVALEMAKLYQKSKKSGFV